MINDEAPRHLSGVKDAAVVETPYLREVRASLSQMAERGGVVIVDGIPGVGKTFATHLVANGLGLPVYWIDMPDRPKGKETTARILKAVSGRKPNLRLSEYAMLEEVVDLLLDRQCVMIVDEAQNLNMSSLRQLRYLHDRPETSFLLVLVGYNVDAHIMRTVPELHSRVGRRVPFREFTAKEMRSVLDLYHPMFANTSANSMSVLWGGAGGNFRRWARILEVALSLDLDDVAGISPTEASAILRAIGGKSRRRKQSEAARL